MTYQKKPKKRLHYRFEGRKLDELPADVDWLAMVETKIVPNEVILKHSYWIEKGSKSDLRKTMSFSKELEAKRSHHKPNYTVIEESWWKKLINRIKRIKWQFNFQLR